MSKAEGFSLVELLVALVFLGLFMAGMAQVYAGSLKSCNRIHEGLRAQRNLRLALVGICEDLRMIGYFHPPPDLRFLELPWAPWGTDATLQRTFMLAPNRPIPKLKGGAFRAREAADDPFEPSDRTADEVSFVMDLPLAVSATLARPIPGLAPAGEGGPLETGGPGGCGPVALRADRSLDLLPGDLLVLQDGCLEWAAVERAVKLSSRGAVEVQVTPFASPGGLPASGSHHHPAGGQVALVRPLRVVRYGVVYLELEGACDLVPCLVRFEAPLGPGARVPSWAGLLARHPALSGKAVLVAEHITGLRVDLSLGGGFPGVRGSDSAATEARLAEALASRPGVDAADPLWFRKVPGLLRVTVEARSPVPRSESGLAGKRAFIHRAQTWTLMPRQFALDQPP